MAGMVKCQSVPLFLPAVCYCLGILSGQFYSNISIWLAAMAISIIAAALILIFCRQSRSAYVFILLGVLSYGGFRYNQSYYYYSSNHIARYCSSEGLNIATISGTVIDKPQLKLAKGALAHYDFLSRNGMSFNFNSQKIKINDKWENVSGKIRVVTSEPCLHVNKGDTLQITGTIYKRNTLDSGIGNYIRRNRILVGMAVKHNELIAKVTSKTNKYDPVHLIDGLREKVASVFDNSDSGSVMAALLLGQRNDISKEVKESFIRSGTMHYLSLSGLHVAMLTGGLWLLLRIAGAGRYFQAIVSILFVVLFMLLVPSRGPVIRAGIMMILFCLGYMLRLCSSGVNQLSFAALLILLVKPLDIFDIGFQLSFSIVFALIILHPEKFLSLFRNPDHIRLIDRYDLTMLDSRPWYWQTGHWLKRWLVFSFAVSVVAWLVSMPLIAWYFNRISWLAPVNSVLLAVPVMLAMVSGIIKIIVSLLFVGAVQFEILDMPGKWLTDLTQLLASVPFSSENTGQIPILLIMLYLLSTMLVLLFAFLNNYTLMKWSFCSLLLCVIVFVMFCPFRSVNKVAKMHFLPVGHGCCVISELSDGKVILYDCGSYDDFNMAENRVLPYLRRCGINHINAVIVSHSDMDHYNGIPDLLAGISVGELVFPIGFGRHFTASDREFMEMVNASNIAVSYCRADDIIRAGHDKIEVLWPSGGDSEDSNSSSIVLKLINGEFSVLLCGDIGPDLINILIDKGYDLDCDYILLPHHGEFSPELVKLIKLVSPEAAIVSSRRLSAGRLAELAGLNIDLKLLSEGEPVVLK